MRLSDHQKEKLTAVFASAATHHRQMIRLGHWVAPPTPDESQKAYLHDPLINRIVDTEVYAVIEILKEGKDHE